MSAGAAGVADGWGGNAPAGRLPLGVCVWACLSPSCTLAVHGGEKGGGGVEGEKGEGQEGRGGKWRKALGRKEETKTKENAFLCLFLSFFLCVHARA